MPYVSHFDLQGQTIDVKDPEARESIESINTSITNINNSITNLGDEIDGKIDDLTDQISTVESSLEAANTQQDAQISDLQDFISRAENKVWVLIGDSWAIQYNDNDYGWIDAFRTERSDDIIYSSGVGGAGFCNGTTYLEQLQSLSSSISDKESVTDMVLIGGINDRGYGKTAIIEAITSFADYVRTNYPNATVHIGAGEWSPYNFSEYRTIATVTCVSYAEACTQNSDICEYMQAMEWAAHDLSMYQSRSTSHLSNTGIDMFTRSILSVLAGGKPVFQQPFWGAVGDGVIYNSVDEVELSLEGQVFTSINDGMVTFVSPYNLSGTFSTERSIVGNSWNALLSWYNSTGFFQGALDAPYTSIVNTSIALTADGSTTLYPCTVGMAGSGSATSLRINPALPLGNQTLSNVTAFSLKPFTLTVPWYWC